MTEYASEKTNPSPTSQPNPVYKHRCERDDFPMIKIDGRLECVAEYIDRRIGQQPVVDIIQRRKTVYYVFENGYELPMLCSCCGGPLTYDDIEGSRQDLVGRRLETMSINHDVLDDGSEVEELVLEFSRKDWPAQRAYVPVSFYVAARMRHPASRPHRTRPAPAKPPRKKVRRRRKIPGRN